MISANLIVKRAIKSAASAVYAGGWFRTVPPGGLNILAYHRVAREIGPAEKNAYYGLIVSTETFRRHCEMIARSFEVVPLAEAVARHAAGCEAGRPLAAITFDDGYIDFYEEAYPVLRDLGLPATVFLPSAAITAGEMLAHDRLFWLVKQFRDRALEPSRAFRSAGIEPREAEGLPSIRDPLALTESLVFLGSAKRERVIRELESELGEFPEYPREYRLLDWGLVREMSEHGIDFGGHTSNHVVLTLEDADDARAEIAAGKAEIEIQTGRKAESFAYPNGEYDARIRKMVEDAGFRFAVTTEARINPRGADPLALGRISLCEESTRGLTGSFSPRVAALRLYA